MHGPVQDDLTSSGRLSEPILVQRLLDVHGRWQTPIESVFKFGGVSWILTSFLSWIMLNAYLDEIGQRGVPLDLAGTWATLVLMGGVLVVALAVLGSTFVIGERIMQPLHPEGPIPLGTRMRFFVAAAASLIVLFGATMAALSPWIALLIAIPSGVLAGTMVYLRPMRVMSPVRKRRLIALLTTWVVISMVLFMMLTVNLDIVLRLQLHGSKPYWVALTIALVQMFLGALLPKRWVFGSALVGVAWIAVTVSPGPYVIVLTALHATNQGGGLPAGPLVTSEAATICNLGTADRPITYRIDTGCTKSAALQHLDELASAPDLIRKARIIAEWRRHVSNDPRKLTLYDHP